MTRFGSVLRWYPKAWRDRYGNELAVLLDDTYGEERIPLGCRLALARSGTLERVRGLRGRYSVGAAIRVRSGSLLVLGAWAVFLVAGAGFAKFAEHWDVATPPADRWVPSAAYASVQWAALLGASIVLTAAALCLPAFGRLVRHGRWPGIKVPVLGAVIAVALSSVAGAAVVIWAHHAPTVASDGNSVALRLGGAVWRLMVCVALAWCVGAAVAVARRLDLATRVVRIEGVLALSMTAVMAVITGGTVAWWVSVARVAPGFIAAGPTGAHGWPVAPVLLVCGLLMVMGLVVAVVASVLIRRSIPRLDAGTPAPPSTPTPSSAPTS